METANEDTLNCYKARFGPDFYAFQHRGVSFIVINSSLIFHLEPELEHHWQHQLRFLETELKAANQRNSTHTIVFGHYPFFLQHPDEDWSKDDLEIGLVIPLERRSIVLELFNQYSVSAVFTGHTPQESIYQLWDNSNGDLERGWIPARK
ncbi:MAG: hypothetical protein CM1200mP3_10440 [Chloroflexota bacterium]|nr:MAG: hypothetical protein CM1200mP3_10440 [Chloroflexota bacterium]